MKIVECSKGLSIDIMLGMLYGGIAFYEGWIDETGIDLCNWDVTDPATGSAWARAADATCLYVTADPNTGENARLQSRNRWPMIPDNSGLNTIPRKLVAEFLLKIADGVANLEETKAFYGFGDADDDRSDTYITGWGIASNVLQSITDDNGTETVATTFSETITNWNKLRMEIEGSVINFFLNEVAVASHTTNLPDAQRYFIIYHECNGGAGASQVQIGPVRIWTEDVE